MTITESVDESVPTGASMSHDVGQWLATLAGSGDLPPHLIEQQRANPIRFLAGANLPGRLEVHGRDFDGALLSVGFDDISVTAGFSSAASWHLGNPSSPSVILIVPCDGRLRVQREDQVLVVDPRGACVVSDAEPVLVEDIDERGSLLGVSVPAPRFSAVHRELALRGPVLIEATPQLHATTAFLGALLIGTAAAPDADNGGSHAALVALLSTLLDDAVGTSHRGNRSSSVRKAALRCIERHHRDAGFGVDEIARELYISRRQLYRAFPDEGGIAGMIARRRLQTAERIMNDQPGMQLSDVATLSGFSTAGVMRAHFRRAHGVTPQRHRDTAVPESASPTFEITARGGAS
ncbi:AraC family transcriptional regulator [Microbacterium koreense]|uniref:AraC family transcriptional regulator n=1 Tax=Microbacterium koreense TaxID=323761 RepID=A0ABW2ZPH0_9MICO